MFFGKNEFFFLLKEHFFLFGNERSFFSSLFHFQKTSTESEKFQMFDWRRTIVSFDAFEEAPGFKKPPLHLFHFFGQRNFLSFHVSFLILFSLE
jgi:hypothetical protein